jgi:hypothetical protein
MLDKRVDRYICPSNTKKNVFYFYFDTFAVKKKCESYFKNLETNKYMKKTSLSVKSITNHQINKSNKIDDKFNTLINICSNDTIINPKSQNKNKLTNIK